MIEILYDPPKLDDPELRWSHRKSNIDPNRTSILACNEKSHFTTLSSKSFEEPPLPAWFLDPP
jgi:hypothetical protein